jgi:hypothetical protein
LHWLQQRELGWISNTIKPRTADSEVLVSGLIKLNIPALHISYQELIHSSVHLPLTPSDPPFNNLINTLHTLLTALNLEPLPMLPPTSRTISHDPLLRQLQMDQSLNSLDARDFTYHARRFPTRCSWPRCILSRLAFGRADWTAGCRTRRGGGRHIGVPANETQGVAALALPFVHAASDVVGTSYFEKNRGPCLRVDTSRCVCGVRELAYYI